MNSNKIVNAVFAAGLMTRAAAADVISENSGGRSSTAAHFRKSFGSEGTAEGNFLGWVQLDNDIRDAPVWQLVGLVYLIFFVVVIWKPLRYDGKGFIAAWRPFDIAIAFTLLLISSTVLVEVTLVPLLTTIIYTRTSYPYLVVISHCIVANGTCRLQQVENNRLQALFLSFFLYGFGGSMVSDILMGLPATALTHARIIPCHILGWYAIWFWPNDWLFQNLMKNGSSLTHNTVASLPVWQYIIFAMEAIDAVTTPMGRIARASRELQTKVTAPLMAGLLAGIGGASLRWIASTIFDGRSAALSHTERQRAFHAGVYQTIGYSLLFWWLAVYRCDSYSINNKNKHDYDAFRKWNHCDSYNGSDMFRMIVVSAHTVWILLKSFTPLSKYRHPFVWVGEVVFGKWGHQLTQHLQLGSDYDNSCDDEKDMNDYDDKKEA